MEELDLKEIFNLVWNKKFYIAVILFVSICLGVIYTTRFIKPVYKSSTTLLLTNINTSEEQTSTITQTDITLNQKLVSTYSELIKSNKVLRQVINNLQIDISEDKLRKNITVNAIKNTEIIQINVINSVPATAAQIANEIANVFGQEVKIIYNIDNVYVVDIAEENYTPSNINHAKNIMIFIAIGCVISAIYLFVVYLLDNTVKSQGDVEKVLGLTVLATIPEYSFSLRKGGNEGE